ncbi:MAG: translation elongation factor Ts [Candidatus Omnitrophica bacterium]|nr:translation elongation factor Ts [Candidatus Omnitrophota bacterium]
MSVDNIKELRESTGCGIMECKRALAESNGDMNKAKDLLRQRGLELAIKKSGRAANEGRIESYIHNGNKMGVIVEVNCETDFVGRNEDFIKFTKDLAMHIAAMAPKYIKKEDVPAEVLSGAADQKDFLKVNCLLEQAYVKDPSKSVADLLNELVAKIGENIIVSRFMRYKIGE